MKRLTDWIAVHRKFVVIVVGAALGLAIAKWGTSNEWVSLGIAIATALGVYEVPNAAAPAQAGPAPAVAAVPAPEESPASSSGQAEV